MNIDDTGLPVGGFVAIVIVILLLNLAGVFGYYKYKEQIERAIDRAAPTTLDSNIVPKLRYGMLGLLSLSLIFSIACTAACTFVKIQPTSTTSFSSSEELFLGLHGVETRGVCIRGDLQDNRIRAAYAFAVMNNLLTSAALIGCTLVVCSNVIQVATTANKVWKIMGFLTLASTWCCLFTFYIQETLVCTQVGMFLEIECSLAGAGVAQVFNSMFLIGICVLFFILPPPKAEENETDGEENAIKTEEDTTKKDKDGNIEEIDLGDAEQPSSF